MSLEQPDGMTRRHLMTAAVLNAVGIGTALVGIGFGALTGVSDGGRNRLSVMAPQGVFSQRTFNLNPFATGAGQGAGFRLYFDHLVLPIESPLGEFRTSGHAVGTGDGQAVTVPCAVTDYELVGPGEVRLTFDDRLDYWNGESFDGRSYWLHDRVGFFQSGGAFRGDSFEGDLESDVVYRRSVDAGERTNRFDTRSGVHPGRPPFPPSFTEQWVERFTEAATADESTTIAGDLLSTHVSFPELADEGYGTGVYELKSAEDVHQTGLVGRLREDHPGSATVEEIWVEPMGAGLEGNSQEMKVNNGEIDVGRGLIDEHRGQYHPGSLPESIEQLTVYPEPRVPGLQLVFDWSNDHLRRLWVRRGLIAAAAFEAGLANLPDRVRVGPYHDTGMLSSIDERAFDDSFLERLYDYPFAMDRDRAVRWFREAGYTRAGGTWRDSAGDALSLTLLAPLTYEALARTIKNAWEEVGVDADVTLRVTNEVASNVAVGDFDVVIGQTPAGWHRTAYYNDWFVASNDTVAGSPVAVVGGQLGSREDESGLSSLPDRVTLPERPGLRVDDVEYADGGARYRFDDVGAEYSVRETVERIHSEGVDEATLTADLRVAARWYNYAVPNFVFAQHQIALWGDVDTYWFTDDDRALRTAPVRETIPNHYLLQSGAIRVNEPTTAGG